MAIPKPYYQSGCRAIGRLEIFRIGLPSIKLLLISSGISE